ncbi:hypothetical protein RDWZM_007090 [Blomia tropicalis]|uniref:GMP reductase n=1 Tax=Blomia tropicalis TaxID=40697 RepID=A0A9Q0M9R0_BLOTA|nr:hypothetical protein RDWZM_007090 [Blomia tropicalis]
MPKIEEGVKLDFKDVLLRPKRSTLKSRAQVDLKREYTFRNSGQKYVGIPLIAANMDTIGTFELALALHKHDCFTAIHKHYTVEEWVKFASENKDVLRNVAVSSGSGENDFEKLNEILSQIPEIKFISFGGGADFVMLGGMLAGHDQCTGEVVVKESGRKVKQFYGMSSATAMVKHHGGVAEYRASEGKTVEVPYRGDVELTILDILGGLRSACTYTGAGKLKELPIRTTFIRVTQQTNEIFQLHEV